MENVNVVVVTGNLTRDPELRSTAGGTSVCDMRVAVNSRRKNGRTGEWEDKPNYLDVTVFGARGESCAEYLAKGRPVAIEGRLDWSEWETKEGGRRQGVKIIANMVQFLGSKDGGSAESDRARDRFPQGEVAPDASDVDQEPVATGAAQEDDIPF